MSWFTPAQQVAEQEYTLIDMVASDLSREEQDALQDGSVNDPPWECGWCQIHAPGATTGICVSCEAKYFPKR